jgi:hypothetical protein
MWASRRDEALRRAVELALKAEATRAEASEARLVAEQPDTDEASRVSLAESAAQMDLAADKYEGVADSYLAMFEGRHVADDDADGFSR